MNILRNLIAAVNPFLTKPPRCPLCHEKMERKWEPARAIWLFACDTPGSCRIAIAWDDPFVGIWDEALHRATDGLGLACPRPSCERPMRYFCTSSGYMKGFCPYCRATLAGSEPDRQQKRHLYDPGKPGVLQ